MPLFKSIYMTVLLMVFGMKLEHVSLYRTLNTLFTKATRDEAAR